MLDEDSKKSLLENEETGGESGESKEDDGMDTIPTVYQVFKYVEDNMHKLKLLFKVIFVYYGLLILYQLYTIILIGTGYICGKPFVLTGFPEP